MLFYKKSTSINSFSNHFSFPAYYEGLIGGKGGRLGFDYFENNESGYDYKSEGFPLFISVSSVESSWVGLKGLKVWSVYCLCTSSIMSGQTDPLVDGILEYKLAVELTPIGPFSHPSGGT